MVDEEKEVTNEEAIVESLDVETEEQSASQEAEDALMAELVECQRQSQEYLDGWQRARAEFANYKKRVERDQEHLRQNISAEILRRYLDVLDDLALALKNRPESDEGAAWASGIELIYRKMLSLLETHGVQMMQADGQLFDPNLHEAISSEPSDDHESGEILEVIKSGYTIGERVLRPALVRVAR
jgi:molecular chaperone GrpE